MKVDIVTASQVTTVTDQVAIARQRLLEDNARRRDERSRAALQVAESTDYGLARAVAAVEELLPAAGPIAMEWSHVLHLVRLDKPSEETLRQLQEALRRRRVLAAFGSRTVVFARDPE